MTKERVGFIGVGLMGHGMARNIVHKGWPLSVLGYKRRDAVDDLVAHGAREVRSARGRFGMMISSFDIAIRW